MKKILLIIILLTFTQIVSSQTKSIVIHQETKEIIPYVNIWVENKNIGTSSDSNGKFELDNMSPDDFIIFSAIGFQKRKIKSDSIVEKIELKPTINSLPEVHIANLEVERKIEFGEFKKSRINSYFACSTFPWIVAKKIDFKNEFEKTPFLKEITLLTNSDIKDSKFKINVYSKSQDGSPGMPLLNKNIIVEADKGKELTKIDLSDYHLLFPKDGLFIAIEWLIVPENKFEYSFKIQDSKRKQTGISYEPAIGSIKNKVNDTWIYTKGKWREMQGPPNKNEFQSLAIKVELTN